jgi:integrase
MPKKAAELGALQVSRLRTPGQHCVGGVTGLRLQVSPSGARSWVLRVSIGGKPSERGLGGFPDVTLAGAREAARAARAKIAAGINPIREAKEARSALAAAVASAWTFDQCSSAYIRAKSPGWSNAKHAAQWTATLGTYASPKIGRLLVRDVTMHHVRDVLEPIWLTKNETATRVRARIENVLDWATVRGYRDGPNPARWKGGLDSQLTAPGKVSRVEHHAALPVDEIGAFMVELRKAEGQGARALEFAILTAARSGEVRGCTWAELDLKNRLWTIPAQRMKGREKEHRVPLSAPAIALLRAQPRIKGNDLVFISPTGGPLSDMTLGAVLKRMGLNATAHGTARSTFRDWCSEKTNVPREVAEMALAHSLGSAVEAAYLRSDLFDKRRALMDAWADWLATVQETTPTKRKAKAAGKP